MPVFIWLSSTNADTITGINPIEFINLSYYLIRNFYYPIIIDDYPFEITNKESLLEAIYYQSKLITVHDLNWDAIQEGLNDNLNNLLEFDGMILLFKKGGSLKKTIPNEFKVLSDIIKEINKSREVKRGITILI